MPSATNVVLPPVLYESRRRFPNVELFLHEMIPDQVAQLVHGRQIDVGFFFLPFDNSALDLRPVSREPLVVALPDTHPLASELEIDLRTLNNEPFVLLIRYSMPGLYSDGAPVRYHCIELLVARTVRAHLEYALQTASD